MSTGAGLGLIAALLQSVKRDVVENAYLSTPVAINVATPVAILSGITGKGRVLGFATRRLSQTGRKLVKLTFTLDGVAFDLDESGVINANRLWLHQQSVTNDADVTLPMRVTFPSGFRFKNSLDVTALGDATAGTVVVGVMYSLDR